jgi:hypothetical protein
MFSRSAISFADVAVAVLTMSDSGSIIGRLNQSNTPSFWPTMCEAGCGGSRPGRLADVITGDVSDKLLTDQVHRPGVSVTVAASLRAG